MISYRLPTIIQLLIGFYFVCASGYRIHAQENDSIVDHDVTNQLWLHLNPSFRLNEKVNLNTEITYRTVHPNSWNRFTTRAELEIDLNEFSIRKLRMTHHLINGIGYYYINNFNDTNAFEFRIYQGYKLGFKIRKRFNVAQYVRIEERFTNVIRNEGESFGLRLRYKLSGVINLEDLFRTGDQGFYIPIDLEFFFNVKKSKQINDVLRFSPGLGYLFNPDFKIQCSISYQYSKQEFDNLIRTNDIIFMFKVFKTFNLSMNDKHRKIE